MQMFQKAVKSSFKIKKHIYIFLFTIQITNQLNHVLKPTFEPAHWTSLTSISFNH